MSRAVLCVCALFSACACKVPRRVADLSEHLSVSYGLPHMSRKDPPQTWLGGLQ